MAFTVPVISSITDAVRWTSEDCVSVRCDRSLLPCAISLDAEVMPETSARTSATMACMFRLASQMLRVSLPSGWRGS